MRKAISSEGRFCIALLAVLSLAPGSTLAAAVEEYALKLLPHQIVSYTMELPVVHPGRMVIEADWSGSRNSSG